MSELHDRYGPEARDAVETEAGLPTTTGEEELARGLELGLPGADSIVDKRIPTFSRGELPHFAGINTFLKAPYVEDVRRCGEYDVARPQEPAMIILGVSLCVLLMVGVGLAVVRKVGGDSTNYLVAGRGLPAPLSIATPRSATPTSPPSSASGRACRCPPGSRCASCSPDCSWPSR